MGFDFSNFKDEKLQESFVEWLVDEQWFDTSAHFGRLWDYYHNPMHDISAGAALEGKLNESSRTYVQAQEVGLPARITGLRYVNTGGAYAGRGVAEIQRKEVVIENDIAWRINAMVDFLFGKSIKIVSKSPNSQQRREIESIVNAVFAANGDNGFFQDMAVLGSVYGFVDCIIRPGREVLLGIQRLYNGADNSTRTPKTSEELFPESIQQTASRISLELIEAPRALPVLEENDYRKINYYVQNFYQQKNQIGRESGFLQRLFGTGSGGSRRLCEVVTEIIGPDWWQKYEKKSLLTEGANPLGFVPVVHIQNIAQPYYYEGMSDVEQLVGLQDELNTRLSDRASRITFQSFKMYLAKGLEGVENKPVSPGRMWCTDNPDASIEQFGGDESSPSESAHITEIREAMDKISGVTPVVAGILKNKLGNLTSGVALKMTFMGMLAKTARKQFAYGQGLKNISGMVLKMLDMCGAYRTEPYEREIEVVFANPLPEDTTEVLKELQLKKELGLPQKVILEQMGYEGD